MALSEGTRRNLFVRTIHVMMGLITAALAGPAGAYLLMPARSRKPSDWIEAADLSALPLQGAEEVVFRRNRTDGWKITSQKSTAWLVRLSDNQVIAFAPQCTHLGCAYSWDDKKREFLCPCHTSNFSIEGKVLNGPAPRPLDRYQVKVEGGKVLLGSLDQPIRQSQGA
jgi:menaquinol-cytochrome c reductase iron-sulfur subunit